MMGKNVSGQFDMSIGTAEESAAASEEIIAQAGLLQGLAAQFKMNDGLQSNHKAIRAGISNDSEEGGSVTIV